MIMNKLSEIANAVIFVALLSFIGLSLFRIGAHFWLIVTGG